MRHLSVLIKRELMGYFTTPIAYVFIIIFLVLTGIFTFKLGQFFQRGQADLLPFFSFHPWLYLFLIPAVTMRLWAEERRSGSIELLLTLPVTMVVTVAGKFLAAWLFTGLALLLTFPMWLTVSYLGDPDHGVIFAGYIGSFLMAGGFLAIGSCISAITKNQVIAFILTVVVCFLYILSGFPVVLDFFKLLLTLPFNWNPQWLLDTVSSFSFLTRFSDISKGVISIRDIVYFLSLIVFWLYANTLIIEMKKAG